MFTKKPTMQNNYFASNKASLESVFKPLKTLQQRTSSLDLNGLPSSNYRVTYIF